MTEKYSLFHPNHTHEHQHRQLYSDYQRNILILRYSLLKPFNPWRLNIHKLLRHWYQLILPINYQKAYTTTIRHRQNCQKYRIMCDPCVRCNLAVHCLVTPFIIRQPIRRPHLLERVYKPMHTSH